MRFRLILEGHTDVSSEGAEQVMGQVVEDLREQLFQVDYAAYGFGKKFAEVYPGENGTEVVIPRMEHNISLINEDSDG